MSRLLSTIAVAATALIASTGVNAAIFTPNFSDYPFTGSQFTVDAAANAFYNLNYGINISNAYLYQDSRDTFDGIGIANGTVAEIGTPQSGRVDFLDTTDFVEVDYLAIILTTYSAYSSANALLSSFSAAPGTGSFTLDGGADLIAYLTFTTDGGFGTVTGMTYNFDGTTGGGNTDLPSLAPEPGTYTLMLAALGLLGVLSRRKK